MEPKADRQASNTIVLAMLVTASLLVAVIIELALRPDPLGAIAAGIMATALATEAGLYWRTVRNENRAACQRGILAALRRAQEEAGVEA